MLVLRNAGPVGGPGMPEWGMLPMPKKLLQQGVRDMLRISDARMSGTSYGACMLHVSPEAAVGGPLALVRTGDMIEVDSRRAGIHLQVDDDELAAPPRSPGGRRRAHYPRGYGTGCSSQHITPGARGLRLRLPGAARGRIPEPEIH